MPAPIVPLTFSFVTDGNALRPITTAERPYYSEIVVPLVDSGTHDAAGVRMLRINGQLFDHPVAQAQYALNLMTRIASPATSPTSIAPEPTPSA